MLLMNEQTEWENEDIIDTMLRGTEDRFSEHIPIAAAAPAIVTA
jgi:hypothetical protein